MNIILYPNAKLNIGLRVTEKRPDGFHNLETVFVPFTGLQDILEICESSNFSFTAYGRPYSLREAGVPKLRTGFTNMERITDVPRPGYLIIFGAKNYYADVHVGMITHAVDMGNGLYQIFTVEGNIGGSTVKRFSFLYDSKAEDIKTNMSYLPQEEWTEEGVHYEGPRQTKSDGKKYNWYVQAICQTWQ